MAATPVPTPLAQAINQASADKQVPSDILAGIWRVETGSTYPNPYVNSIGYGGLFGTAASQVSPSAPPLEQAEYAASILRNLLISKGGSISQALRSYSGNGYTQVPGEVTFGTWHPGAGGGGGPTPEPFTPGSAGPSLPVVPAGPSLPGAPAAASGGDFGPGGGSFGGGDFGPGGGGESFSACLNGGNRPYWGHNPNEHTGAAGLAHDCWPWETWGKCWQAKRPARGAVDAVKALPCMLRVLTVKLVGWLERFGMILGGALLVGLGLYLVGGSLGAGKIPAP